MTIGVIVSLLLGIAAVGLGVEDLRKIDNINNIINQVDFSVPATTMLAPAEGAKVSGIVPLDAAGLGGKIRYVEFLASTGGSHQIQIATAGQSDAGFVVNWDSTKVANATYEITSVGYDALGKSLHSAPITVTVDNVAKL
jgi:hypothetical protein